MMTSVRKNEKPLSRRTPLFGEEVKKLTEALAHIRGLWSAIKGSLKLTKKRGDYFTTAA